MDPRYADIIKLPHHVSPTRPRMSMANRAAQFAPFAALSGYGDAVKETGRLTEKEIELDEYEKAALNDILNELKRSLDESPAATINYFVPDAKKAGGAYVSLTGTIKKIDEYERLIIMSDGEKIPIAAIADIIRTE